MAETPSSDCKNTDVEASRAARIASARSDFVTKFYGGRSPSCAAVYMP